MYLRRLSFLVCLALLASSCSEDPAAPNDGFSDLTLKENVVSNLQKALNEESTTEVTKLLDDLYTFCWEPPSENMECFNRTDAVRIVARFFESGWYSHDNIVVERLIVKLSSPGGEAAWVRATTDRNPAVKLFEKVVNYELVVRQGGNDVSIGTGMLTVFLVEKTGTYKLRGIFDHEGLWGSLHRAYESGP